MASESKPDNKARMQDIVEDIIADEDVSGSSDSEPEQTTEASASSSTVQAATTSSKKKKKKKGAKSLKKLIKGDKNKIPQALVNEILERAKQETAQTGETVDEETVRQTIEQLKVMDVIKGKSGLGGQNKKDMGEHKVS